MKGGPAKFDEKQKQILEKAGNSGLRVDKEVHVDNSPGHDVSRLVILTDYASAYEYALKVRKNSPQEAPKSIHDLEREDLRMQDVHNKNAMDEAERQKQQAELSEARGKAYWEWLARTAALVPYKGAAKDPAPQQEAEQKEGPGLQEGPAPMV